VIYNLGKLIGRNPVVGFSGILIFACRLSFTLTVLLPSFILWHSSPIDAHVSGLGLNTSFGSVDCDCCA